MTVLYAHRGSRLRAPENTARAFALAMDEGADGVELDVRTCRSGEVVVVHDRDLSRVAGDPREVAALGLRDIRRADLGDGQGVLLLDEALDLVVGRGGVVNVEVKGDAPDRPGNARAVARLLRRRERGALAATVVSTFDPLTFLVLREELTRAALALLFDREHTGNWRGAAVRRLLRPDGLHPEQSIATARAIRRWKRRGLFVNVWTVNEAARVRFFAGAGVDGIVTDDVPTARAALLR